MMDWERRQRYEDEDAESAEELRAPAPVQDVEQSERGRQDPFLEDFKETHGDEEQLPRPTSTGHPQSRLDLDDGPTQDKPNTTPNASRTSPVLREISIIGHIAFFSILGTLARLGLQWLTFYPGAPITTSVIWANVGGSYFMGFLSEDRRLFQHPCFDTTTTTSSHDKPHATDKARHSKVKKTIPLYIGLATAFCGSLTSFSSFMRDAFLALSNDLPSPYFHPYSAATTPPSFSTTHSRSRGYSVFSLLAVLISEPALSLSTLIVGAHTALALERILPSISYRLSRRIVDPAAIILGFGVWLGAVLLAIFQPNTSWRSEVLFALVFAPLGALLRYYASLKLNPLVAKFPLGTFAVNIFGSAVLAMSYDLQHVSHMGSLVGGGMIGCGVLQGIEDGFCGCLTTVSTWVAEIQGLRRRHAYVYALMSMAAGLAFMVVIMGGVRWSVGWSTPVCTTMRTSS